MPKKKAVAALKKLEQRKRKEFSAPTKRAAFERCKDKKGAPYCEECHAPLSLSKKFFDHIKRDVDGGLPTLENCQVLCKQCHDHKTGNEKTEHSKALRAKDKHQGTSKVSEHRIPQPPKKDKPEPKSLPPRRGGIYARFFGPQK